MEHVEVDGCPLTTNAQTVLFELYAIRQSTTMKTLTRRTELGEESLAKALEELEELGLISAEVAILRDPKRFGTDPRPRQRLTDKGRKLAAMPVVAETRRRARALHARGGTWDQRISRDADEANGGRYGR